MMSTNVAKELVVPDGSEPIFRVVFLYVGQGESTLLVIPMDDFGRSYSYVLTDANLDEGNSGIYLPHFLNDLVDENQKLSIFINTHPHKDHLNGLSKVSDKIDIANVWHSGHKPSKEHDDSYKELQKVIKKVKESGGSIIQLLGTRETKKIGLVEYNVLSPAEYVVDDIGDETPRQRDARIHEHCSVLRFSFGSDSNKCRVLITGDADKAAWEKHITEYHGKKEENRIRAQVLSAPHHGSRSAFMDSEDDEDPYVEHLEVIHPSYVVISAPRKEESPHGHPHDDALTIYLTKVKDDNRILHTGRNRYSFILTVYQDGTYYIDNDSGLLAKTYRCPSDNGGKGAKEAITVITSTKSTRMG